MKRMKVKALFLAAALAFPGVVPATAYATEVETEAGTEAETEGPAQETEESIKVAPYMFRTELAKKDNYNDVRVWLELNPANSESIASYQIALQLEGTGEAAALNRTMELEFDEALQDAQVKETKFDAETQTLRVYVAGTKNLVQTGTDGNGNPVHRLPIGTVKVNKLDDKEANKFKIVAGENAAELITVGMDHQTKNAAEVYGKDDPNFEIPSDGTIYGVAEEFALGVAVKTIKSDGTEETDPEKVGGTVKAYLVSGSGNTLLQTDGVDAMVEKGSKVRLVATPEPGYRLKTVSMTDENDEVIELKGDFTFNMTGSIDITATFEEQEGYTVAVGEGGSIQGAKETSITPGYKEQVTVVASVPAAGKKFSHWEDSEGNIVSYKEKYSFWVLGSVTLTPKYVDKEVIVEQQAMVDLEPSGTLVEFPVGQGKYRLTYTGKLSIPAGCKAKKRGIVLINKESAINNLDNFIIDGKIEGISVAKVEMSGSSEQFIISVNNVKQGVTRVARAYLIYTDEDGNEQTVYGDTCVTLKTPTK